LLRSSPLRFGPLIVAITGAALILLELRRFGEEGGVSIFWIVVGALAMALGIVGHVQRKQGPTKSSDDRSLPPLDRQ